jgi:hypothetical protein
VSKFVQDYLRAGEGKYITPQVRVFAFPVNYFGRGAVNAQFVRNDVRRYMRRWPVRRYTLLEPVKVTMASPETAIADFKIAFNVRSGKRRGGGETNIRVMLREIKGQLKIIAIEEQRGAQ